MQKNLFNPLINEKGLQEISYERGPYKLSLEEVEHLRTTLETLNPKFIEGYRAIETRVNEALLKAYGNWLTRDQINYINTSNVIVGQYRSLQEIEELLPKRIPDQDWDQAKLNNQVYRNYEVIPPDFWNNHAFGNKAGLEYDSLELTKWIHNQFKTHRDTLAESSEQKPAVQLFQGRVVICPPIDDIKLPRPLSADMLIPEAEYDEILEKENTLTLNEYVASYVWAGTVAHEKIHGLQDYDIPLPILEAHAHYEEDKVAEAGNWTPRNEYWFNDTNYWHSIEKRYTREKLNLFMFGNLPDTEWLSMLRTLKRDFSKQTLLTYYPRIFWKTQK